MADPIVSSPECSASTYRKRRNKYYAELEGVRVELQQQLDEQDPSTWDPREIQEHVRDISNFSLVIKKDAETLCFTEEDEGLLADDKDAARAGDSLSKTAGRLAQKMSDLQEATTIARELEELLVDFAKDMEEDPQLDTQQGAVPIMDLMKRFKNLPGDPPSHRITSFGTPPGSCPGGSPGYTGSGPAWMPRTSGNPLQKKLLR